MSDADLNASARSVESKMSPIMTSPKERSSRNQSGFNMVPGRHSGKEKKQKMIPPNRMIQQKFLKLLTNVFNKSLQFSQKS